MLLQAQINTLIASVSGQFTPRSLAAVKAWWNASNLASLGLSGADVTSWTDEISGYVLSAGDSGATRPDYSATSMNGAPGLTFNGAAYLNAATVPANIPTGVAEGR